MGCLFALACDIRAEDRPPGASEDAAAVGEDAGARRDAGRVATGNILVARVLDGDTLVLSAGSSVRSPDGQPIDGERVRLIGIDTPEIAHDPEPADCFGDEAAAFTRQRLEGRLVTLEYDFSTGVRGDFGRLLAYVVIGDETFNETLLREGYAEVFRRFDFREKRRYLALEAEARRRGVGLWSACP